MDSVSQFIMKYERGLPELQEQLKPIANRLSSLVLSSKQIMESFLTATAQSLRGLDLFRGVQLWSDGYEQPPVDSQTLDTFSENMFWFKAVMCCVLLAPGEVFQQQTSVELVKRGLLYSTLLPIHRNEVKIKQDFRDSCLRMHACVGGFAASRV
jgi:hypothetical protein